MSDASTLNDTLNAGLTRMEQTLHALEVALASNDTKAMETTGQALQNALVDGMKLFQQAGPQALTPDLRQRLQLAHARVQAQLQTVHKVLASTSQTLSILMPVDPQDTYDGTLSQGSGVGLAVSKAYR